MSVLRTGFAGSYDAALFDKTETYGTVTQTGDEMIFTGDPIGAGICYVTDKVTSDLSAGDNFAIELAGTTPAWPCRMWLWALDAAGKGWGFRVGGTGVNAFQIGRFSGGVGTWAPDINYGDFDIAVHKFLRLSYASGTVYWDYSTDGSAFTNRSSATPTSGFDPATLKCSFGQLDSDSNGIYKVTNYWAPTLAGGGSNIGLTRRTGRYPLGGFLNNGFIR